MPGSAKVVSDDRHKGRLRTLSKALSALLRHGAVREGLPMGRDGYALVCDVLDRVRCPATVEMVLEVVATSDKQRFSLRGHGESLEIRANQGHSLDFIDPDLLLTRITDASEVPVCVHGTRRRVFDSVIRHEGLCRMSRQHIHFAQGLPGDDGVISGMRKECSVLIFMNVKKMLADGIPLFVSSNGVLLSPGQGPRGMIPPEYFGHVEFR